MADVFVSYDRDDRERIAELVALLEAQGWSVFWDRDIPSGKSWRSHLVGALERARCVVVLWTDRSIESDWVAEEADFARQRDVLVPVLLDPVAPPLGFRTIQAASLLGWPEAVDPAAIADFLRAVAALLAEPTSAAAQERAPPTASVVAEVERPAAASDAGAIQHVSQARGPLAVAAVLAVAILAGVSWWLGRGLWHEPSRVVGPAGPGGLVAPQASVAPELIEADLLVPDQNKTRIQDLEGRILPLRSTILRLVPRIDPLRRQTD
jgi:hypothetical protein